VSLYHASHHTVPDSITGRTTEWPPKPAPDLKGHRGDGSPDG
jgi:hypothetical protein